MEPHCMVVSHDGDNRTNGVRLLPKGIYRRHILSSAAESVVFPHSKEKTGILVLHRRVMTGFMQHPSLNGE